MEACCQDVTGLLGRIFASVGTKQDGDKAQGSNLIEIGMASQLDKIKLLSIIHPQSLMLDLNLMILTPDPILNVYQLTALNNLPKLIEYMQTSR